MTVEINIPRVPLWSKPALNFLWGETRDVFFAKTLAEGVELAQAGTPVGATGDLQESVVGRRDGPNSAKIEWTALHAKAVDEGTRPHWPPHAPIALWTSVVLGEPGAAYAVQGHISREGTPAKNYSKNVFKKFKPKPLKRFITAISNFVRSLNP